MVFFRPKLDGFEQGEEDGNQFLTGCHQKKLSQEFILRQSVIFYCCEEDRFENYSS